jgi:sulfonate transport system ATP-binding protein
VLVLDGGQLAYDEPFELPRPRRRDHPELVARRRELLTLLGVADAH